MKDIAILATVFALTACGKGDKTPVDMAYRVTVETIENTCDGTSVPEGTTAVVDVFANGDDSVTFVPRGWFIPGERAYPGLAVREGKVNHRFVLHAVGYDFHHDFDGTLTMEKMDITMHIRSRKPGDGEFTECSEKVRLRGEARPMWDLFEVDGKYRVTMTNYGEVCPGGTPSARGIWNAPLDVDPYVEGRAVLSFDEKESNVFFDLELGADGIVDWEGPMYALYANGTFADFDAHVTGTVAPGLTDLTIAYRLPGDMGDCAYVVGARGGKSLPSPTLIDNEYRVNYLVDDDCKPIVNGIGPHEDEFDFPVDVVMQDDGSINLLESPYRLNFDLEGGAFSQEFFYNWGEAIITYEGAFDPPYLDYSVEWHFWPAQEEYECRRRIEAHGHIRYWLDEGGSGTSQALALPSEPLPEGMAGPSAWPGLSASNELPQLIRLD